MKKINVKIFSHGSNNDSILTMIGNHNGGKANINLQIIAHYIDAKVAQYPSSYKDTFVYTYSPELNTLDISENNFESFTLQLTEVEDLETKETFTLNLK